jgi:hypothetical protein
MIWAHFQKLTKLLYIISRQSFQVRLYSTQVLQSFYSVSHDSNNLISQVSNPPFQLHQTNRQTNKLPLWRVWQKCQLHPLQYTIFAIHFLYYTSHDSSFVWKVPTKKTNLQWEIRTTIIIIIIKLCKSSPAALSQQQILYLILERLVWT